MAPLIKKRGIYHHGAANWWNSTVYSLRLDKRYLVSRHIMPLFHWPTSQTRLLPTPGSAVGCVFPADSGCVCDGSHLLSSTSRSTAAGVDQRICAAARRALLGGAQRMADVLDVLLPGRGQGSRGASTHRAAAADLWWSRRCFYFTEAANICQLTPTAQKRNCTHQLTRNCDVHFRNASPLFKLKVIVSSLKVPL